MKFVKNRIGPWVSRLIMPAQGFDVKRLDEGRRYGLNGFLEERIRTVGSTQGALIDAFEVVDTSLETVNTRMQKVFIHLHGNATVYEAYKDHYRGLARKHPGHRIVGFNCRNVEHSQGIATCEDDWVDDAVAMIRYYEKQGIRLENMILIGHSLGGAILTMAAARIYQEEVASKGKQNASSVKVLSNRSFSTLPKVVVEWLSGGKIGGLVDGLFFGGIYITIKTLSALFSAGILASLSAGLVSSLYVAGITAILVGVGHIFPAKPTFAKPLIHLIVDAFLRISFGTMDALSAYKLLPDNAKDHMMAKDDAVILPKASLHYGLKSIHSPKKRELRDRIEKAKAALANEGAPNREALLTELSECKKALLNLKDSKLCFSTHGNLVTNWAHICDPHGLRTYHKNRGRDGISQINGEAVYREKIARLL